MNLLARVAATAWALEPAVLDSLTQIVIRHDAGVRLSEAEIEAAIGRAPGTRVDTGYRVENGVGIVPISGVIAKYSTQVNDVSQAEGTSCDMILQDLRQALADPNVHAILLQIESPGGAVDGVADTASIIRDASKIKPVCAFIDDIGASAAYWMASQASTVYATATAVVGSIGVRTVMIDNSKQTADRGLVVHSIASGPAKAVGQPGVPISAEDRAVVQARVDSLAAIFQGAVQSGRDLSAEELAAVSGGHVWIGAQAQPKGLIDGVRTYDQVMSELAAMRPRTKSTPSKTPARASADLGAKDMKNSPLPGVDPDAIRAEAEAAGAQATLDRLAALEAAFPKDPAFAMQSFKAGHSVDKAKGEYAAVLQTKLDAETAKVAALETEKADLAAKLTGAQAEVEVLKKTPAVGVKALHTAKDTPATGKTPASSDARIVAYEQKKAELVAAGEKFADKAMHHKHPELHAAWIDAVNGK
jgi:signal peptide peptidase SppA